MDDAHSGVTKRLATAIVELKFADLPAEVIDRATSVLLDTVGVSLVGATRPHAVAARAMFEEYGGAPTSSVMAGVRTSAPFAAYLNSLAASSTPQLDDIWKESLGHPGVGVVPAALAIAEQLDADGPSLIEAIVAGYEVSMRVGAAVGNQGLNNGWHPRGGLNVFGAAAAVGKLRGLDIKQMVHALSLAGNTAAGLTGSAYFYDSWYTLSANASLNGVIAADLAATGFTSGPEMLETPHGGYLSVVVDEPRWSWLENPGKPWIITQVGQKLHASSGATHAAVDATLLLVKDHDLRPDDVDHITVYGFASMVGRLGKPKPQARVHCGMSIPHLVATAIAKRAAGLGEVIEAPLNDPVILGLQDRMTLFADERLEAMCPDTLGARVVIATVDGRELECEVLHAKGDPRNPLTDVEIDTKFRALAGRVLDGDAVAEVESMVKNVATWESCRPLMCLLGRDSH